MFDCISIQTTSLNSLRLFYGNVLAELWALRVNQLEATRPDWNYAQLELETNETDPAGQEVNIVFEGRASNGGFAIDDIMLYEGSCRSKLFNIRAKITWQLTHFNVLSGRPAFATPK